MNDDHFYDDISPLTVRDETNFTGPKVPNFMAVKIGYISDIHIDDKVGYKYEPDRKRYTKFVAKKLMEDVKKDGLDLILFLGDTSHVFEINKTFVDAINEADHYTLKFFILGNHELWDISLLDDYEVGTNKVDHITQKYRQLFLDERAILLQNELFIFKQYKRGEKISAYDILHMTNDQIQAAASESDLLILGGLGFSGYSKTHNATHGYYRIFKTLEEDLIETQKFEEIYLKLKQAIPQHKLIVMTHTPKENWSTDSYCKHWIYVNGHTHQNTYTFSDNKKHIANNQVGYEDKTIGLKYFMNTVGQDCFVNYADGIHEITREQYLRFYFSKGKLIQYNPNNETKLYLLKNKGLYLFISQEEGRPLMVLNGGRRVKASKTKTLDYFYENMHEFAHKMAEMIKPYQKHLQEISNYVQSFGGSGHIHGAIVDIDYYNHLYINPFNGEIIPYHADSMTEKYVFRDVLTLLLSTDKKMSRNYLKLINKNNNMFPLVHTDYSKLENPIFDASTTIYKYSRIILNIQKITEIKVITFWNDELFKSKHHEKTVKNPFYTPPLIKANFNNSSVISINKQRETSSKKPQKTSTETEQQGLIVIDKNVIVTADGERYVTTQYLAEKHRRTPQQIISFMKLKNITHFKKGKYYIQEEDFNTKFSQSWSGGRISYIILAYIIFLLVFLSIMLGFALW